MSGPSGKPAPRTAFVRPSHLLLGALVASGAAAALAFVMIDALPVRHARESRPATPQDASSARPPAFADDLSPPLADPPPPPTAAEIEATSPTPEPAVPDAAGPPTAGDPASLPIDALRKQADTHDLPSMVEMSRRLILGIGIAKDPAAGAGWMLRAAELGSSQAAFNVGVMYESGFVVERDSTRAAQWYRRAADAGLPAAEHNLALMLRDGKGVARDGVEAIKLFKAAAHQGMTASMFALGDIYEKGDAAPKDDAAAIAWFAMAAQFERRAHDGKDTPLARSAQKRSQDLQRVATEAELQRARDLGQHEIREIVDATAPRQQPRQLPAPALPAPATSASPSSASATPNPADGWPAATVDQVRAIQQALFDLNLLHDKPDGALGPMTRSAIRDFQRSAGLAQTGEPTEDVYVALKQALAKRDDAASSATRPPPPTAPDTGKAPENAKP